MTTILLDDHVTRARQLLDSEEAVSPTALIDAKAVSSYFGCTVKTLRERELRGELPKGVKIGTRKFYRAVDIRRLINRKMRDSVYVKVA